MPDTTLDRGRLRNIRTFPQLVAYLRDDLEWPIEDTHDFEDLTFDYTPEELGIDAKTAARIQDIKQLRPLTADQPWGIFFVKFEPKRLPVVALRRILGKLVFKKRDSANKADRAAWDKHDLLFISNFGEGEERQITFAHFADKDDQGDLPTLKVLGWDQQDTALHLDDVHDKLYNSLRWPEDDSDVPAWRTQWSDAFELEHRQVITTSRQLAQRLADLARNIRKRANAAMRIETDKGPLKTLMRGFREALIHDLSEDDFADMYAQTIAYGLLSARVSRPEGLIADNLADMVPVTNPFLKDMLTTFLNVGGRKWSDDKGRMIGIDFDELGVNDVVDTLREANMEAVLRDFGNKNPTEDPVIHFYELFLKEYDAKKRMQRGVFYTPRPVVSYIVRSVHELLQTEFGLQDGLASTATWAEMLKKNKGLKLPEIEVLDPKTHKLEKKPIDPATPFVQILDPATGTATFLVEVIDLIHKTMAAKWKKEGVSDLFIDKKWNDYVPNHLLPRLFGYELMMAPYAIAHMKIGLKLFETGYRFGSGQRARIYLTNALEPPQDFSDQFEQMAPALAHEAKAVNDVKRHQRFTVVIGNPPYSIHSGNLNEDHRAIVEPYKFVDGERIRERGALQFEKNIQDDYIKFIRLAETRLNAAGAGILGIITNSTYLDGSTFRGVRRSLQTSFNRAWLLDLHGNAKDLDATDENVFEILQPVAISIYSDNGGGVRTIRGDLIGSFDKKQKILLRSRLHDLVTEKIVPQPPLYMFTTFDADVAGESGDFVDLNQAFKQYSAGMITARDSFVIDMSASAIEKRVMEFARRGGSDASAMEAYAVPLKKGWDHHAARISLAGLESPTQFVRPVAYRPYDERYVFYHQAIVWGRAYPTMQHMLHGENIAIACCKQLSRPTLSWQHIWCGRGIGESCLVSNRTKEVTAFFPLFKYEEVVGRESQRRRVSNIKLDEFQRIDWIPDDNAKASLILNFIYAILHSPTYRERYRQNLARAFPKVPRWASRPLFEQLAILGGRLLALHLLESPLLNKPITTRRNLDEPVVEKPSYDDGTIWLDKKRTCGFVGVPEAVWNFHIGGYQVCHKWLKDRKGRTLSADDIAHYQKIVVALNETIRLMKEIDQVIERHGGWPGAFVTEESKTPKTTKKP